MMLHLQSGLYHEVPRIFIGVGVNCYFLLRPQQKRVSQCKLILVQILQMQGARVSRNQRALIATLQCIENKPGMSNFLQGQENQEIVRRRTLLYVAQTISKIFAMIAKGPDRIMILPQMLQMQGERVSRNEAY